MRNTRLRRKTVEPKDSEVNKVDDEDIRQSVAIGKLARSTAATFLDSPNGTFNVPDMFPGSGGINEDVINKVLKLFELEIHQNNFN